MTMPRNGRIDAYRFGNVPKNICENMRVEMTYE